MTKTILYGIPNCDTVKKARNWLQAHGTEHQFHDFKKAGLDAEIVAGWLKQVTWETLVNKKGTTWRALPDEKKASILDASSATALMLEAPSVIKRPVLCTGTRVLVGFNAELYETNLNA